MVRSDLSGIGKVLLAGFTLGVGDPSVPIDALVGACHGLRIKRWPRTGRDRYRRLAVGLEVVVRCAAGVPQLAEDPAAGRVHRFGPRLAWIGLLTCRQLGGGGQTLGEISTSGTVISCHDFVGGLASTQRGLTFFKS